MSDTGGGRDREAPLNERLGPEPRRPARRVVSLCPSLTETLFDLGVGEQLVGVTRFCIHPAAGVAELPKLGGTKDPELDWVRALEPDLVLMNREENRREDAEALARELPVSVSFPRSPQDVPAVLEELGGLLGCQDRASELARQIRARAEALASEARGRAVRYAYLIWRRPWMAAGRGSYVDGLLGLAGGVNVFGPDEGEYPQFDLEQLAAREPRLVILSSEPFPFKREHAEELRAAGVPGRIELADGDDLCWHGSRTLRGLELAGELMRTAAEAASGGHGDT